MDVYTTTYWPEVLKGKMKSMLPIQVSHEMELVQDVVTVNNQQYDHLWPQRSAKGYLYTTSPMGLLLMNLLSNLFLIQPQYTQQFRLLGGDLVGGFGGGSVLLGWLAPVEKCTRNC